LKSGDLVIYINSVAEKKEIKKQKSWAETICLSAVARKRTWPVIVHGVKMKNYQLNDAWKKHTKNIEKENAKLALNLRIRGMR
jgi:hypothetical protein